MSKKTQHSSTPALQHSTLPTLRRGFTLVEMLVVIGILGILASVLIGALSHMKTVARQSQAQTQVNEVMTAFNVLLQQDREWPAEFKNKTELDATVCLVLQKRRMLDLTTYQVDDGGNIIYSGDGTTAQKNLNSLDRYGMLDPWGRIALRRNPKMAETGIVEGGRKLSDHRIQFRMDLNYDGYVDAGEGSPKGNKVRTSVLIWSRGPDGRDATTVNARYPGDDQLSWNYGQSRGEK
ncbi:MAG: type II secretion system protein [bacterium]